MQLASGGQKKLWRCNQWWNKRCRSRVYTIGDLVTPLNKYHTHEDIIKRKKRVSRGRNRNARTAAAAATVAAAVDGQLDAVGGMDPLQELVMMKLETSATSTATDD